MILNNEEKKRLVDNLTWMITDLKWKANQTKLNIEEGSQGGYSPKLTSVVELLDSIKKIETVEVTGCHRKVMGVNCREFKCELNRQGVCALSAITLESTGSLIVGKLNCVQAKEKEKKEKEPSEV